MVYNINKTLLYNVLCIPYSAKVIKPPEGLNFRTLLEPALDAKVKPPRGGLYLALHGI
jgi:hypothetical protein